MSPQELGKEIRGWIERFVSRYPQGAERIWRTPLVGSMPIRPICKGFRSW